jgi:hypothetical protein
MTAPAAGLEDLRPVPRMGLAGLDESMGAGAVEDNFDFAVAAARRACFRSVRVVLAKLLTFGADFGHVAGYLSQPIVPSYAFQTLHRC